MVPSGIDKEKLLLQLDRLEGFLRHLGNIQDEIKGNEKNLDATVQAAAERNLQICIEECINIGNHLISGLHLARADTYKDVFLRLEEAKIISGDLSTKMQEFATFRNRLVHMYWEVSKKEIIQKIKEMEIVKEFARKISKLTATHRLL